MSIKDWITNYPTSIDTTAAGNMETLANNVDVGRVSQLHALRNAIIAIETEIGKTTPDDGSLRKRVDDLETDADVSIHDNVASEIHLVTQKATPISADELIAEDSADSWNKKRITIGSLLYNTLDQAYDQGGSGSGRIITADSGAVEINASGSNAISLNGYISLSEISDPSGASNTGILYTKDDGGDTELFYMDNSSNVIQLTQDGSAIGSLPLTTKGDLLVYDTTNNRLPVGTNGYVLTADSTEASGIKWAAASGGAGDGTLHSAYLNGRTIWISSGSPILIDGYGTDALEIDGYLSLLEISDPSALSNTGMLYTKDDSGDTELFYMDNSSNAIQITKDGYLNTSSASLPLTTKGDLLVYDTTNNRLPVGSNGQVLTADSTEASGIKWATSSGSGSVPHEQGFTTTGAEIPGSTKTFGPLNATPRGSGTADTPSGYDIIVFRNGVKMQYNGTPSTYMHYYYDSANNEIDVLAPGSADTYEIIYGE